MQAFGLEMVKNLDAFANALKQNNKAAEMPTLEALEPAGEIKFVDLLVS